MFSLPNLNSIETARELWLTLINLTSRQLNYTIAHIKSILSEFDRGTGAKCNADNKKNRINKLN